MTNQLPNVDISLHIPPQTWYQFRQAMQKMRCHNEEVIGFFFCQRHQLSKRKIRYVPKAWVVPSAECYERQSTSGLVLKQQFHLYLLKTYLCQGGLDVVHIHTHFGQAIPSFSNADDCYESEYARFLAANFPKKPRLISGVFDKSLQQSQFRLWNRKGRCWQQLKLHNDWFERVERRNTINESELMFARQKVFGQSFQKQLGELSVTLIGCGGIGAIFAEILGRLGVKNWTLIDPDRLEASNLNRMPAATQAMVDQQWYKVHYVKQLIKRIYAPGIACVKAIPTTITDKKVKQEIATTDLIVVATDNHISRQIAQELALEYMRPLISLGTHIEVKPNSPPRMYCRVTVPPLGGGWCLMCGNIINLQTAALELAPPEINRLTTQAGYLASIDNPAVYWLNNLCASTGVGVIHGLVSGFLNLDAGLDWIYDFPRLKWHKANTEYLTTPDCYFCSAHTSAMNEIAQ